MISDITLGQFFPGFSLLHKLDPRTKILLSIAFIAAVFVANNPASFVLLTIVVIVMIAISRISPRVILKGLKPIVFILIFTALLNIFLTKGETLLFGWKFIEIYLEGIVRAVFMAFRVMLLIVGTSLLLTYTTSPIALTDGIESLLSPLKLLRIPVHSFAMMMSIALRFIPTLVEETEKIMNAQKSRGADFDSGNILRRAKALVPLLVPLFVSSFKRADELATAMECRCYRGDKNRTKLVKLSFRASDFVWMFIFALILAISICSRIIPYNFEVDNIVYNIVFYSIK